MNESVAHKCPSCSANLPFDPEKQLWHCGYCGGDFRLEDLNKSETKKENERKTMNVDVYSCSNCGAQIITDENTTATFCVYCRSTAIIKDRLNGLLKPTSIIPFKKTKEEAVQAFKKFSKGKLFAPKDFSDEKNINEISGVYIPFWLYDGNSDGTITANAEKISSWTSGDYRCTKTDTYSVRRSGEMAFERVPADGSEKFDDALMDSIEPFDYGDLGPFDMSYLSGFLSEKYNVGKEEAFTRAQERMKNATLENLQNDIIGYTTVNFTDSVINVDKTKDDYVLLPVWMLNIKYKDKIRKFAMNGQTGRMIGDVPISKLKLFAYWGAFFVALFAIMILINVIA